MKLRIKHLGPTHVALTDSTVWPLFDGDTFSTDTDSLQWKLAYGTPTKADLLLAASYVTAYEALLLMAPERREELVKAIVRADLRARRTRRDRDA